MTSLFVDRRNVHLQIDAGALVFRENGERVGTVPLAPITRVFLRGNVVLEASVLGKLGENGAGVAILSGRQGKLSLMLGRPHHDARRRVEQARHSFDPYFCLRYSCELIGIKLQRQREWLHELCISHPHARHDLIHAIHLLEKHQQKLLHIGQLESLRGLEGASASAYFAGLRAVVPNSLEFNERNRRPPRDPFNVLLSLTYTMATAEVAMLLHAAGLDPCIGFYHQLAFSRESLACDLVETVRPLADSFCLQLVAKQTLTKDHFSQTESGCFLGKAGRVRYYAAYEEYAPNLRHTIEQSVQALVQMLTKDLDIQTEADDGSNG